MNKEQFEKYAKRILEELGIPGETMNDNPVSNEVATKKAKVGVAEIYLELIDFGKTCRVDINISLPEGGVMANTYMDYCAKLENIPKNHHHEYCSGPRYRDYASELRGKNTFALSPWNNTYFYIRSEDYGIQEIEEAVTNAIALAKPFIDHLADYPKFRFWNPDDAEVVQKAKDILTNADFEDVDIDYDCKAHYLHDRNSFMKGWFYPFYDRGRGAFDTNWPSSLDYAAKTMGNKGTFEYAVACRLLENKEFIAKAREACRTREETVKVSY